MNYLLETHTLIWFLEDDSSLSKNRIDAILDEDAKNYVSIASIWEIAIKSSLNKLQLNYPFTKLAELLYFNNIEILSISFADTLKLTELPFLHKDTFDRIIISQGITNNLTIISKDDFFKDYPTKVLW